MPRSKQRKTKIIQCCIPTNEKDEKTKEVFYNRPQTVLDKMKEKDRTILMGDFNAKIGANNTGYEDVRQGHDEREWPDRI